MISTREDFIARLEAGGQCTPQDVAGWRDMLANDPATFDVAMRAWVRAGAKPDKTFWQETADLLDPASDVASKLIPIVTLALML